MWCRESKISLPIALKKKCNARESIDLTIQAAVVMFCTGVVFLRVSNQPRVPWCSLRVFPHSYPVALFKSSIH